MPTYEYACKSCGQHFDIKQSFADASLTVHDNCGGELRKVFQPAPIVFKGSGWYVTDSRSKPPGEDGSASPATTGNGKSDGKAETTKSDAPKSEPAKAESKSSESKSDSSSKSDSGSSSPKSEKVA